MASPDSLRSLLAAYGRHPARLQATQLRSWWTNVVLLLEADGERLILRCYGITPPGEVAWELALLDYLNAHGFPTIRPLPGRTGGSFLSVHEGMPAILYPYIEESAAYEDGHVRLEDMVQTAALAGRLNRLTQGLTLPHPRRRSGTETGRLLAQLLDWAAARGVSAGEHRLAAFVVDVEKALTAFQALDAPALPRGIIHHDAHGGNVVFHDGKLAALIDFDDACPAPLIEELCPLLDGWARDRQTQQLVPHCVQTVLAAYHRERPLTALERDVLPEFQVAFQIGDAASFVYDRAVRGHAPEQAIAECHTYRRYLFLLRDSSWRQTLKQALAGLESSRS